MMIAPIFFTTVVVGIARMGHVKEVGRVGPKTLLYFEGVTTLALNACGGPLRGRLGPRPPLRRAEQSIGPWMSGRRHYRRLTRWPYKSGMIQPGLRDRAFYVRQGPNGPVLQVRARGLDVLST